LEHQFDHIVMSQALYVGDAFIEQASPIVEVDPFEAGQWIRVVVDTRKASCRPWLERFP